MMQSTCRQVRAKLVDTGTIACINNVINYQQTDGLGNITWRNCNEACGYTATEPLNIGCEDCITPTAYMFNQHGTVAPEATAAVRGCSGEILGYISPTITRYATIPLTDCGGAVIGYAYQTSSNMPNITTCTPIINP